MPMRETRHVPSKSTIYWAGTYDRYIPGICLSYLVNIPLPGPGLPGFCSAPGRFRPGLSKPSVSATESPPIRGWGLPKLYSGVMVIVDVSDTTPWSLSARRLKTLATASFDSRGCELPSLSKPDLVAAKPLCSGGRWLEWYAHRKVR